MGTWNVGHFDSDAAEDFTAELDSAEAGEREAMVRGVLLRTAETQGRLDEAQEAVAAAALVAAQCPGGDPIGLDEGPEQEMPPFGADVRGLAVAALDRVLADAGLADSWVSADDRVLWLSGLQRLRLVLASV